jgi:uncharacterized Zn-binding protein involved in type VI secretion
MQSVARFGDTISTGHGCDTVSTVIGGSPTVFVNGRAVIRATDPIAPHTILAGIVCVPHAAVVNAGSSTVFVNGIPIARVGDSADAGVITSGSLNVFAGG